MRFARFPRLRRGQRVRFMAEGSGEWQSGYLHSLRPAGPDEFLARAHAAEEAAEEMYQHLTDQTWESRAMRWVPGDPPV